VAFQLVITTAQYLWQTILVPLGGYLAGAFSSALNIAKAAFQTVADVVGVVGGAIGDLISAAIGPLTTILQVGLGFWIGVVSTAFDIMGGAIDIVSGTIETLIGWISDAIGWVQDLIDKIESIPGGGIVGDIIGALPGGADGGIFTSPTAMLIGEAGKEVLLPLTDPARTLALAKESGLFDVLHRAGAFNAPQGTSRSGAGVAGGGGTVININTHVSGAVSDAEADRIGNRIGNSAADVLDKREARVEARIA